MRENKLIKRGQQKKGKTRRGVAVRKKDNNKQPNIKHVIVEWPGHKAVPFFSLCPFIWQFQNKSPSLKSVYFPKNVGLYSFSKTSKDNADASV